MVKHFLTLMAVIGLQFFLLTTTANADNHVCNQDTASQCIRGYTCVCEPMEEADGTIIQYCYRDSSQICGSEAGQRIIGPVRAPAAVARFNADSSSHIGLISFLSVAIRVITIISGIFAMFNFIIAGAQYVFAMGNTNAHVAVRDRLLFSVIGLLIIVAAYTSAGLIGLIFFGDVMYVLEPSITSVVEL